MNPVGVMATILSPFYLKNKVLSKCSALVADKTLSNLGNIVLIYFRK